MLQTTEPLLDLHSVVTDLGDGCMERHRPGTRGVCPTLVQQGELLLSGSSP